MSSLPTEMVDDIAPYAQEDVLNITAFSKYRLDSEHHYHDEEMLNPVLHVTRTQGGRIEAKVRDDKGTTSPSVRIRSKEALCAFVLGPEPVLQLCTSYVDDLVLYKGMHPTPEGGVDTYDIPLDSIIQVRKLRFKPRKGSPASQDAAELQWWRELICHIWDLLN